MQCEVTCLREKVPLVSPRIGVCPCPTFYLDGGVPVSRGGLRFGFDGAGPLFAPMCGEMEERAGSCAVASNPAPSPHLSYPHPHLSYPPTSLIPTLPPPLLLPPSHSTPLPGFLLLLGTGQFWEVGKH